MNISRRNRPAEDPASQRRSKSTRPLTSTIGLKLWMALSGLAFIAFVLGHVYGNLKAFSGHDAYNEYAEHLRTLGQPIFPRSGFLWVMRAGLALALCVHVACAVALWRRARRARSIRYLVRPVVHTSIASRTMRAGGAALLLFLIWHLANFTIGKVNVAGGPTHDPYVLLVDTFRVWWSTAIYLAGMLALGFHLWHGTWSTLQTLGWATTAPRRRLARGAAAAMAIVIAGGFSLSPVFILCGVVS